MAAKETNKKKRKQKKQPRRKKKKNQAQLKQCRKKQNNAKRMQKNAKKNMQNNKVYIAVVLFLHGFPLFLLACMFVVVFRGGSQICFFPPCKCFFLAFYSNVEHPRISLTG